MGVVRKFIRETAFVVTGIKKHLVEEVDKLSEENRNLCATVERLDLDLKLTTEDLKNEKRKSGEYFALIERIEKQRNDRWSMFLTQSSQHQNAQATLENTIFTLRQLLSKAIIEINARRKITGEPAVVRPIDLLGKPIGTAKEFEAEMLRLKSEASADIINAVEERNKITHTFEERDLIG